MIELRRTARAGTQLPDPTMAPFGYDPKSRFNHRLLALELPALFPPQRLHPEDHISFGSPERPPHKLNLGDNLYVLRGLAALAEELVRKGEDLIWASTGESAVAAACATRTIPIVFIGAPWPVEAGKEISTRPFQLVTGRAWMGSAFGGARGRTDVPKIVDWYMDGKINIDDLITRQLPLDRINDGYDLMKRGESIRSVVID